MKDTKQNKKSEESSLIKKKNVILHISKGVGIGCAVVFMVALAIMSLKLTAVTYPEYLQATADLTPFFTTLDFFGECMLRAGGLVVWGSSGLTSCFRSPWIGASIFTFLLCALPFVVRRAFSLPWGGVAVCFIPSAMLLANLMQMGYMVVALRSPAVGFTAVLGVYLVVLSIWLESFLLAIKSARLRRVTNVAFYLILTLVGYPLFGFWGIAAVFGCLIVMLCRIRSNGLSLSWTLALALFVLVLTLAYPQLLFRYVYTRLWIGEIYTVGLPLYKWEGAEVTLWYPLLFTMLLFAVMPVLGRWLDKFAVQVTSSVVAALVLVATPSFAFDDPCFYSALRMANCVEQSDWDGVIVEANKIDYKPSRLQGMLRMLAQVELGTGPDDMFSYEDGDTLYSSPRLMPYSALMGARYMYYYLGKVNYSYRWCMEGMVSYGQCPTYLKFMAKCALVNGEPRLAEKYIDGLRHTWFYRDFADKYEVYVKDTSLVAKDAEMKKVREYMHGYNDLIDSDGGLVETYLTTMFANLTGGSYKMGEMSLLCNLLRKKLQGFWVRFQALQPSMKGKIPRHYQEAVVMLSRMDKHIDTSSVPIDPAIAKRFDEMMAVVRANGYSDEQNKVALKSQYGDTYWYYCFFADGLK